jgi:feruloyl-CoA synthase
MLTIPPKPPVRPVRLGPADVAVERRADGVVVLRSPHVLGAHPGKLTEQLSFWAAAAPDRALFAKRDPAAAVAGGWRTVTYAQALDAARRIGAALLRRDLSAERPVMILSGNDIEHALLGLAANYVGIPYAPVSPAYSLISTDFGKLRHVVNLLTPGLVFAADGAAFCHAIDAAVPPDVEVVVTKNPPPSGRPTSLFPALMEEAAAAATDAAGAAHAAIVPDAIAKFLFTSGSTGTPKAVINTQRMWCANQEMLRSTLAFFADEPPVIVDWAPWHHTAGGNHDVGLVIYNGGTFYIDDGKPAPGAIGETVRNLRDVAPNWYFNVPKGFEALLPFLRDDARLRETFFSRLKVLWFAGAGIGQHVFDEMKDLAVRTCGEQILFLTGLGATETAPFALCRTWDTDNAANVGLPPPGLDVKLVPMQGNDAGKFEARLRGPSITPGYWRDAALTAAAFDDEGFYRLGDAFRFHDPAVPARGLLFEGRIAEDFKLATGTWVHVGPLRVAFIAHFTPFVRDVVIAGPERDALAALVLPDIDACRRVAPHLDAGTRPDALLADPQVRREFQFLLGTFASQSTGSSNRIARMAFLAVPPSLDAGEITDKGSINQRAVLRHRAAAVDALYATPAPAWVIAVDSQGGVDGSDATTARKP